MSMKAAAAVGVAAWLSWAAPAGAADKPQPRPATRQAAKPATAPPPAASAPAAAASAPVLSDAVVADLNRSFKTYVVPRFAVQAEDRLDPEVLEAAQAMQAEHLPRVRALMERWLIEEMQQPNPQHAYARMLARLTHEFALWGRDSIGPAQDAALAQALQMPGMCRPVSNRASELILRLGRLRGLPPEVRQEAVKAERELLARWGRPRQVSEAEPVPAEEALLQLRATRQPPKLPLPQVLAYYYLGDTDGTRLDPFDTDPWSRCAMHQWAGADPAQFRAAVALQAADVIGGDRRRAAGPSSDDDAYPSLASYLGVRGVITVQADVNAEGRVVRAKVLKRAVEVPGVRDGRPFAHERLLDQASLTKARELDWSAAAAKQGGLKSVEREFEWSLKWR